MSDIAPQVELPEVDPEVNPQVDPEVEPEVDTQEVDTEVDTEEVDTEVEPQDDPRFEQIKRAFKDREISTMYHGQLCALLEELIKCEEDGLIAIKITDTTEIANWQTSKADNCILQFSKLIINDPNLFCDRMDKMAIDNQNIWNPKKLKQKIPTYNVYVLFRRIGLCARFRASKDKKNVIFNYKEWYFKNDNFFREHTKLMDPEWMTRKTPKSQVNNGARK